MPKKLFIAALIIFGALATIGIIKKSKKQETICVAKPQARQEIILPEKKEVKVEVVEQKQMEQVDVEEGDIQDEVSLVEALFVTDSSKLPLVETVTYSSRVPWLSGRPAWIADYASHYQTTRHFIARSLNRNLDYFTQKVAPGDRFNVLKKDISFHLLIDLTKAKMRFYGIDNTTNKRYLLKTYKVGLGRKDSKKASGLLTPKGKYLLGSKVAIYRPGTMGYFQDRQIEMIRVFGTRWMPFEKEISGCTDCAKGYGLHGSPWFNDTETGHLSEDREKIGQYESDGCIRLFSEDIEEIFAIVISKPTVIELVSDFKDAELPGEEVSY